MPSAQVPYQSQSCRHYLNFPNSSASVPDQIMSSIRSGARKRRWHLNSSVKPFLPSWRRGFRDCQDIFGSCHCTPHLQHGFHVYLFLSIGPLLKLFFGKLSYTANNNINNNDDDLDNRCLIPVTCLGLLLQKGFIFPTACPPVPGGIECGWNRIHVTVWEMSDIPKA